MSNRGGLLLTIIIILPVSSLASTQAPRPQRSSLSPEGDFHSPKEEGVESHRWAVPPVGKWGQQRAPAFVKPMQQSYVVGQSVMVVASSKGHRRASEVEEEGMSVQDLVTPREVANDVPLSSPYFSHHPL